MEGPGWVETLKQGQEGDRWHLGEFATELWPHSPGWGGLLSPNWGLQNGTTTLLPPLLFQPLKREQRRESVCLQHRELARLKGSLVSSLSVRSCRKNAPRPSVGIRNMGMEGANAVTRSVSQVSDLGVLPLSIFPGHLHPDGPQDHSAQHGQSCFPYLLLLLPEDSPSW